MGFSRVFSPDVVSLSTALISQGCDCTGLAHGSTCSYVVLMTFFNQDLRTVTSSYTLTQFLFFTMCPEQGQ